MPNKPKHFTEEVAPQLCLIAEITRRLPQKKHDYISQVHIDEADFYTLFSQKKKHSRLHFYDLLANYSLMFYTVFLVFDEQF